MELKYARKSFENVENFCSNRTFMELKFTYNDPQTAAITVLIVPLWNWNGAIGAPPGFGWRSNRTFMELKLGQDTFDIIQLAF